jgi:preprotein translocase subunit SecB
MNKAAFSLESYRFEKVSLDFTTTTTTESNELTLDFDPSGNYTQSSGSFDLLLNFTAIDDTNHKVVEVNCVSTFTFADKIPFEEIPEYFYANSIAILFPYVRAFVSTVTLQANVSPIVLPTMNLTSLQSKLRDHTLSN